MEKVDLIEKSNDDEKKEKKSAAEESKEFHNRGGESNDCLFVYGCPIE